MRGLIAAVALAAVAASTSLAPATAADCVTPDAFVGFYPPDEGVFYRYGGNDVAAILAVTGPPRSATPVALLLVGIDEGLGRSDLFAFDAGGCYVDHLGPVSIERAGEILHAAGVKVPFGSTYHQLPGIGA